MPQHGLATIEHCVAITLDNKRCLTAVRMQLTAGIQGAAVAQSVLADDQGQQYAEQKQAAHVIFVFVADRAAALEKRRGSGRGNARIGAWQHRSGRRRPPPGGAGHAESARVHAVTRAKLTTFDVSLNVHGQTYQCVCVQSLLPVCALAIAANSSPLVSKLKSPFCLQKFIRRVQSGVLYR